jgi:WD40 repeat protein
LIEAKEARIKILKDAGKSWEMIGAKFDLKFSFGGSTLTCDSISSFPGPPNANSDHDYSDRLIYRVGAQVCIHDVENGEKYFLKQRPQSCTSIIHVATDTKFNFVSVCEAIGSPEDDENSATQLSVYSLKGGNECVATLIYPTKSRFIGSVFANGYSSRHVVALCSGPQHEIVVWNWETKKIVKTVPIPDDSTRIRCAPSNHLMLTTSGKHGLKVYYGSGDNTSNINLLSAASSPNERIEDHCWLPSGNGIHKMVALTCVVDPNEGHGKYHHHRRQYMKIFEGRDQQETNDQAGGKNKSPVGAPILLECRQTVALKLNDNNDLHFTCVTSTQKGFCFAGSDGRVLFYERTDDKREPYIEVKSLSLGEEHHICGINLLPSEGIVAAMTYAGRLLSIPTEMNIRPQSSEEGDEDEEKLVGSDVTDFSFGGNHTGPITAAAMALERSIIVTMCAEDNTLRVWNYETKKCEVVHHFGSDEPVALAVHPSGLFLVVSFKDRLRGYNIGMASLKPYKEVIQKGCKEMKYSHGASYIACSSGINLIVFDAITFKKLIVFQGHMMPIRRLAWGRGDQIIFTAGVDGSVIGWPISRQGRIDVVPSNPRNSSITDVEIDAASMVFLPPPPDGDDGGATSVEVEDKNKLVILATMDGNMKLHNWMCNSSWEPETTMIWGEQDAFITTLKLSKSRRHLFAGTKSGKIRVYAWPPVKDTKMGIYAEVQAHNGAVTSIHESPREDTLISAGEDGSVFTFSLTKAGWTNIEFSKVVETDSPESATIDEEILEEDEPMSYNQDILLLGVEEMEEHVEEMSVLKKKIMDIQLNSEYRISQMESKNKEETRNMSERFDRMLQDEKERYEALRLEFDDKVRTLLSTIEAKEADSVKVVSDLENRYEHKLADQLDRYDQLSEEMELLRQKCEGLLLADRTDFTKQLNETIHQARLREKKMRSENKRITDDRTSDEAAFKEILDQQEHEYEDELRQLITAAEGELIMERENIAKLRTLVQTKNTKLDQLKKKLVELSMASKARATLLNNEKNEKMKLLETIEHYKKNLAEREEVVADKEKIIMELRSKTRTLENFRFVLDYRLQQLTAERGPITTHIEGLERHITTMYEELVEEFESKKNEKIEKEKNDQRNNLVIADLNSERLQNRKRERFVTAFKRELGNIVSAMVSGKELEESVRLLYRKFVKGETIGETTVKASEAALGAAKTLLADEDDILSVMSGDSPGKKGGGGGGKNAAFQLEVEETLIETAKEAERQKMNKEKEAAQLKSRLDTTQNEALTMGRKRRGENSNLLFEVNELRKSLRKSDNKIFERDETIKQLEHKVREMKLKATLGGGGGGKTTRVSILKKETDLPSTPVLSAPPVAARPMVVLPNANGTAATNVQDNAATDSAPPTVDSSERTMEMSKSTPALAMARGIGIDIRLNRTGGLKPKLTTAKSEEAMMMVDAQVDNTKALSMDSTMARKKKVSLATPQVKVERQLERLQNQVTSMSSALDESYRVRENQRVEISQLRKNIAQMHGKGFGSFKAATTGMDTFDAMLTTHTNEDTMNLSEELAASNPNSVAWNDEGEGGGGSIVVGNEIVRSTAKLTEADRTGHPSENDLKALALGPAAASVRAVAVVPEEEEVIEEAAPPVVLPMIAPAALNEFSVEGEGSETTAA